MLSIEENAYYKFVIRNKSFAAKRLKTWLLFALFFTLAWSQGAAAVFEAEIEAASSAQDVLASAILSPDSQDMAPLETGNLENTSLENLQTSGFAVLPAGKFMNEKTEAAFNRQWQRKLTVKKGKDEILLLRAYDPKTGDARWKTRSRKIQRFLTRLTAQLREALPGEDFFLGNVQIQVSEEKIPRARDPHIDSNLPYHLVVSYPLHRRTSGTVVYKTDQAVSEVETVPAGPRQASIFSGIGREISTKRLATIHAAPRQKVQRRAVLLVTYISSGVEKHPRSLENKVQTRARRVWRLLKSNRKRS